VEPARGLGDPPARPGRQATRRYLLAGLVACGRRLESAWSNGKPAYWCRHGYTSATGPEHGRPKNTYVREDQILPHLAAMAILLGADHQAQGSGTVQLTAPDRGPDRPAASFRRRPHLRPIRADGSNPVAVTTGPNR